MNFHKLIQKNCQKVIVDLFAAHGSYRWKNDKQTNIPHRDIHEVNTTWILVLYPRTCQEI